MRPRPAGVALIAVGVLGLLSSVAVAVVGLRLVGSFDTAVRTSARDAGRTVQAAQRSLVEAEASTRQLEGVMAEAEVLLSATADLSEDEVAGSVAAVGDALPALIDVAAIIDRTLSTLASLPFGLDYDPGEPFDLSLRRMQDELAGLPADLRAQAQLIRDAGANLGQARDGVVAMADALGDLRRSLEAAQRLADGLAGGAEGDGSSAVDPAPPLRLARLLVLALAGAGAAAQVAPLLLGFWLLRRDGGARRDPLLIGGPPAQPPPPA